MDELSQVRNEELSKLKVKIGDLASIVKPRCPLEWNCRQRALCPYDHTYLFRKVNPSTSSKTVSQAKLDFLCEMCGNIIQNPVNIEFHIEECHEKMTMINGQCENPRDESGDMTSGVIERKFQCHCCKLVFPKMSALIAHQKKCFEDPEIECYNCGIYFATEIELDNHKREIHSGKISEIIQHTEKKMLSPSKSKCNLCLNDFTSVEEMEKHKESDHKINLHFKSFYCYECHKSFKQKLDLENHKKSKHGSSHKPTQYSCNQCNELFASVSDLK